MTDAIAEVTSRFKELKTKDDLTQIHVEDLADGCKVSLVRGILWASSTAKTFGIAYTAALKDLNSRRL